MKTYFVLVCWNNIDLLDECIDSIKAQSETFFSIIIVDNGSTDGSVDYIKKNHKDVILIDTKENNGFAIGNNKGIEKALEDPECKYVALVNTDATLDKDWLKTLVSFSENHSNVASMQTPTLDYYDHKVLDSRGITINYSGHAHQIGYREVYKKRPSYQVFGVNAAAAVFSAAFLREQPFGNDYFDSDLWMYLEDVDIAARAIISGWDNWYVDGSFAYHMGSVSSSKNPGFSVYHIYRNHALLLIKNLPLSIIAKTLPGLIKTDAKTLYSAFRGHDKIVLKNILKGRFDSISMMGIFIKKRHELEKYKKISTKELWKLMNPNL